MKTALSGVVKWGFRIFALLLIVLAVTVQMGRSFSHLVADYKEPIAEYLSTSLNARVTFTQVEASWDGLRPRLAVSDLHIANHAGEALIGLQNASVKFDILRSLAARRWVWNSIILHDVQLDFIQLANGKWRLSGVPGRAATQTPTDPADTNTQAVNIDQLLDMLLLSNRIEFVSTRLHFLFEDRTQVELTAPSLLLENSDNFHRLTLAVDLADGKDNIQLLLEGEGDPRDRENFRSKGFLAVSDFPTRSALEATSDFLVNGLDNRVLDGEGTLNAKIWLETTAAGTGFDLTGAIGLQQLKLSMADHELQLDNVSTQVRGQWLFNESWWLDLIGLQSQLGENRLAPTHLNVFYQKPKATLGVRVDQIDLAKTYQLSKASGVLGEGKLSQVLESLNPRGTLDAVHVSVPLNTPDQWRLRAQLQAVAVDHWQGVPALTAVDGYVETGARDGFVNLAAGDGFSMHFVPTYDAPMIFDQVSGQVAWHIRPEQERIYINSGALNFTRNQSQLVGHMLVDLPLQRRADAEPRVDLTLQISGQQVPVSDYAVYVPALVPESLSDWLATALGDANPGVARQVGLLYRGNLASKNPQARSLNLFIDVDNANLAYHPRWPALTGVSGEVYIRDAKVDANIRGAALRQSHVGPAQLHVQPNATGEGSWLQLDAQVNGSAEDVLATLRDSQLRDQIGNNMDSWQLTGTAVTHLNLGIPIGFSAAPEYAVITQLGSAALTLGNLDLRFSDLSGSVQYTHHTGFTDTQLQGFLFDQPVTATLTSHLPAPEVDADFPRSHIHLAGAANIDTLASWSRRPELKFMDGIMEFEVMVDLFHRPAATDKAALINAQLPQSRAQFAALAQAQVTLTSDLMGVSVNLPGVLGKAAAAKESLEFEYTLQASAAQVAVNYGDKLYALAHVDRDKGGLLNASVGLLEAAEFSAVPEFLVTGNLPRFDIDLWRATLDRYQAFDAELAVADLAKPAASVDPVRKVGGLPFRAKVTLDNHAVGPINLQALQVEAAPVAYGWHVHIQNPVVSGSILLPDSAFLPLQIELEHLRLEEAHLQKAPAAADAGSAADSYSAADSDSTAKVSVVTARDLPAARVAIKALHLGEQNFGRWSFSVNPNSAGVVIDNIQGSIRGLKVGGVLADAPSAILKAAPAVDMGGRLIWQEQAGVTQSRFIGSVSATNMAEVSRQWQVPELLESEAATFNADLHWPGAPSDIALNNVSGALHMVLTRGRFHRNATAGDGVLRLLSVVNFDSIARRLRLDFSDLYQSGLAYDSITGNMALQQGLLQFKTPLDLRGPSSRLQLAGSIDLNNEQLNTRLIATLPVAGNLTFVAALITGLPAAAGVYIVSKLFKKQMDRATSITYTITGEWDNPTVRFTRFFESEDNLAQNALQSSADSRGSADAATSASAASSSVSSAVKETSKN